MNAEPIEIVRPAAVHDVEHLEDIRAFGRRGEVENRIVADGILRPHQLLAGRVHEHERRVQPRLNPLGGAVDDYPLARLQAAP